MVGVKRMRDREKELKEHLERETWAALSLGDAETPIQATVKKTKKGRKGLATATISIRGANEDRGSYASGRPKVPIPAIRIIPPLPSLRSLSMYTTLPARQFLIRQEFEEGWVEGFSLVLARIKQIRDSYRNGVRVVEFVEEGPIFGEGFSGLKDVGSEERFASLADTRHEIPVLCLWSSCDEHTPGCGHALSKNTWGEASCEVVI